MPVEVLQYKDKYDAAKEEIKNTIGKPPTNKTTIRRNPYYTEEEINKYFKMKIAETLKEFETNKLHVIASHGGWLRSLGCKIDENDIEVKVKKQKKMKKYNIEEVLKHKDWIVMEVNNERRVYDLSKWIPQHPGGDKIYNGIEANMYYKDPKKYNKKPYDIFMRNNIHKEKNIFELFFERTHKLVKHIGFLI